MSLAMVVSRDLEDLISVENIMPWHDPSLDVHWAKVTNSSKIIVMGRKTAQLAKLPTKHIYKILTKEPDKHNRLVCSKYADIQFVGLDELLRIIVRNDCLLIGGAETIKTLRPYVKAVHLFEAISSPIYDYKLLDFVKLEDRFEDFSYDYVEYNGSYVYNFLKRVL